MSTNKTNLGLVEWSKKYLGHPYWYGTFGNVANEKLLQGKRQQYPSHYQATRLPRYRSQFGRQVFDCAGLIKGYLWDQNGTIRYNAEQDMNANTMLSRSGEKGPMSTMPDIPGVLVYFPGHVGVYIGNGRVVEAQGFVSGVIETELRQRPWRNWSKPPFITYAAQAQPSQSTLTLEVNGRHQKETQMKNVSGRAFVRMLGENNQWHWIWAGSISDVLGGSIDWDGPTQTVKIRIL